MSNRDVKLTIALLLSFVLFMVFGGVEADVRGGIMPASYHLDRDRDYNERHQGFLIEYYEDKGQYVGFMTYNNSFKDRSNMFYGGKSTRLTERLSIGVQGGLVTGYSLDPAPYVVGTVTYQHNNTVSSRLLILPVVVSYQLLLEF